jgi:nitrogen fixation NifU-like protein
MNPLLADHFMNPRNAGSLEPSDLTVRVGNPVCGDAVEIDIQLGEDARIGDIRCRAWGCSASQATASILSDFLKNKDASALSAISKKEISTMLGELAPRERHCRGYATDIIRTIVNSLIEGGQA